MSNNMFQLNYELMKSIAQRFKKEGEDVIKLHSSTRQRVRNTHKEWIGEASDKFFEEMETELLPALQRLSSALFQSQHVTGEIMRIIEDADTETAGYFTKQPLPADNSRSADRASTSTRMTKKIIDTIHDLNVEENKEYKDKWVPVKDKDGNPVLKDNGEMKMRHVTFCNKFVQDFCKIMGVPFLKAQAIPTIQWLKGPGSQSGWKIVSAVDAAQMASQGNVVLVGWEKPVNGHGHIAVVRPESTIDHEDKANIWISQAGAKNFESTSIKNTRPVKGAAFFVYDP